VLAAQYFPNAIVDATDLSGEALDVAKINARDHGLDSRIKLHQGNLYEAIGKRRYDLILANPPYVAEGEVEAFPAEYKAEPRLAHIGGVDGLDLVRTILCRAKSHLNPGGSLICEIGLGREILEEEIPEANLVWLDTAESEGEVFLFSAQGRKRP
jgi:ribosomal protein L3 glutamine methyltransferase